MKLYESTSLERRRARRGLLRCFASYWDACARAAVAEMTIAAIVDGLACPRRPARVHVARLAHEATHSRLEVLGWRLAVEAWATVYRDVYAPLVGS